MPFAYPSQTFQDWLSQCWCIASGRKLNLEESQWLVGPFGNVDVIGDRYVADLAASEGLEVQKNRPGFGIIDPIESLNLPEEQQKRINPQIVDFYENTIDYEFEVWTQWCQFYRPFAGILASLYSRRLQQLNLPQHPLDTSRGIRSQIYKLVDTSTGRGAPHDLVSALEVEPRSDLFGNLWHLPDP